jgi:hypothetical protein
VVRVAVPSWGFQCCGDPFAVGTNVSWPVSTEDTEWFDELLPSGVPGVDAVEDHHDELPQEVVGIITGIEGLGVVFSPVVDGIQHPLPGSGVVTRLPSGDGWDEEATFAYLVTIDGTIRSHREPS